MKKNIFGFSIVNTTKQCFNNQSVCPLNSEIFKSDFACLYRRNCRFYAPVDIAICTGTSKTMTFSVVWFFFLWQKNLEFSNFVPEFIICGAMCIKFQFKSPFFSKIVMAASLRASPLHPVCQILSVCSFFDSG